MENSAVLREVTLTLPMLPDMEIAASKTATAMAEFMEMSSDKIDEVRMAVVEACINSFEHSRADDRTCRDSVLGLRRRGTREAPDNRLETRSRLLARQGSRNTENRREAQGRQKARLGSDRSSMD